MKFLTKNKRGLKPEEEKLPCSTAASCKCIKGNDKYLALIVAEYRDPFGNLVNTIPEAAIQMFESIATENMLDCVFSSPEGLGGELFSEFFSGLIYLGSNQAPLDADFFENFSVACALINITTLDTKIACHGPEAHILFCDKETETVENVWPRKNFSGSQITCYGFSLTESYNLLLCNHGFFRTIYSISNKEFYSGNKKVLCTPLNTANSIFYPYSLNDTAFIAVDLSKNNL